MLGWKSHHEVLKAVVSENYDGAIVLCVIFVFSTQKAGCFEELEQEEGKLIIFK